MKGESPVRISEWASVSVEFLSEMQREAISEASEAWQVANGLGDPPLAFSGPRGDVLCARQYVGVVEVGDVTIEIYPKLDKHLVSSQIIPSIQLADSVMQDLLWMLEVSGYMDISETDTAHLCEQSISFYDVFAYLMAKNLLLELQSGVPHSYISMRDAIPAVRGRINLLEQVTSQWNRLDRVACIWDEFTPDIPLNRLFKCVCRILCERVVNSAVSRMLVDCLMYLDSVADVSPRTAIQGVNGFRWDRSNERLRMCFDMAIRLLEGTGYRMTHGAADSFVFMMDMNQLFEDFAANVLGAHLGVKIETQKNIGKLFRNPGQLSQYPDYIWRLNNKRWIGDAKYKHLAAGSQDALRFSDNDMEDEQSNMAALRAARVLNTNDVRQLIVYAELLRLFDAQHEASDVAVLYPFVGDGKFEASNATAFNGSEFWVVPVKVKRSTDPAEALPSFGFQLAHET